MILFGILMERFNRQGEGRVDWSPFVFGSIAAISLLATLLGLVFGGLALALGAATLEPEPGARSANRWCADHGWVAAINASLYQADHLRSTAYLRAGDHVNNAYVSRANSFLAFGARREGIPNLKFSLPGSEEVHRITAVVVRDDSEGRCCPWRAQAARRAGGEGAVLDRGASDPGGRGHRNRGPHGPAPGRGHDLLGPALRLAPRLLARHPLRGGLGHGHRGPATALLPPRSGPGAPGLRPRP